MGRVVGLAVVVVVVCLPVLASEPGQPLDCSDWVFLEPGFTCVPYVPYPQCGGLTLDADECQLDHRRVELDNEGFFYRMENVLDVGDTCDSWTEDRVQLVRFDAITETVIGYVQERCNPNTIDIIRPFITQGSAQEGEKRPPALWFDAIRGGMIIGLKSDDIGINGPDNYPGGYHMVMIRGFTTTFEILQTYTPTSGPLSFRVPYMPEGFQYGDYFDTYWGDLATVGDWSQAQPLQCGYPATAPSVGDYLAVEDSLPTPAPGHGYYYVTAVNYQGQRRYGRQSNGGVLSGRDPAVLPICAAP